jgi:hypothetical protein
MDGKSPPQRFKSKIILIMYNLLYMDYDHFELYIFHYILQIQYYTSTIVKLKHVSN